MANDSPFIRWFGDLSLADVPIVGGKNASLGEMYRELSTQGVRVPNGFAVTAAAYRHVVAWGEIGGKLEKTLAGLDTADVADLARRGRAARDLILGTGIPADLWEAIAAAYARLCDQYGPDTDVAVRSSATAEDLPTASFAGQQETYLNICGEQRLSTPAASVSPAFSPIAPSTTAIDQRLRPLRCLAVDRRDEDGALRHRASSGVMFSLDTESGFRDVVFITASYGLGENIVQGVVNPDEYYVHKPTYRARGFRPFFATRRRQSSEDGLRRGRDQDLDAQHPGRRGRPRALLPQRRRRAGPGRLRHVHRGTLLRQAGQAMPMDIEWAKDGPDGELFIVQARPETVQALKDARQCWRPSSWSAAGEVLVKGKSGRGENRRGPARANRERDSSGRISSPARSWWPTPPRRTGSR